MSYVSRSGLDLMADGAHRFRCYGVEKGDVVAVHVIAGCPGGQTITLYLGLDVHKDSITIAIAEPGSKGEIRLFGTITNDMGRLEHTLGRIRTAHPGAQLEVAYEAGPCGFVIARRLKQLQVPCLCVRRARPAT